MQLLEILPQPINHDLLVMVHCELENRSSNATARTNVGNYRVKTKIIYSIS